MAEEAQDVQSNEISLADFMADEQESPKAESSPVKEAKTEAPAEVEAKEPVADAKETEAEVKADDTATETEEPKAEETDTEDQAEAEVVETDTKPQTKADERKSQLNTEIRDLVAQRNALKEEVTKRNSEVYQPATEEELVDEGLSATDAKVEALRQQIEVRDFNERVADAQLTLESESNRVLSDFPIFNPESEQFDEELAQEAAGLLQSNLQFDPNTGQVIGSNVSPYALYKTFARAAGLSETKGQLKGQQSAETMLANADTASSAAPTKKPVDPLMELWKSDD